MITGFTGSSAGITLEQDRTLWKLLSFMDATEVHHGDCVGGDKAFHDAIIGTWGTRRSTWEAVLTRPRIIIHPPDDDAKRAFCEDFDEIREPLPYLVRNRAMVYEVSLLIAAPRTKDEELRSGTWATVRYARKRGVPVIIISPDGGWYLDGKSERGGQ